jgi:hypothetical protein
MLQLAPRGEIAIPIPELEDLQLRPVKTEPLPLWVKSNIRWSMRNPAIQGLSLGWPLEGKPILDLRRRHFCLGHFVTG